MSYQDQPEQNGASFRPPPPRNHYRTRNRDEDGLGCCLLECLCCCLPKCLCCCVIDIIITFLVAAGVIALFIWLGVHHQGLKFKVTDATLTTFNFTADNNNNTNILNFDLAANLTVRNPNHRSVYYDDIQANLIYSGQRLKTIKAMAFYQGQKNTSSLGTLVFKGQNMVILESDEKLKFDQQSEDGLYDIEIKFYLRIKFNLKVPLIGIVKTRTWKPKVKCNLKVPLVGKSSQKFQETTCHYYF